MATERFVLDSYALLALLQDAPEAEPVKGLVERALSGKCDLAMSIVNLGEVAYITEREKGLSKAQEVLARVDELPIRFVAANRSHAMAAAHIKAHWPMAYADCFAAALAVIEDAAVVTGDPEFEQLESASVLQVAWL